MTVTVDATLSRVSLPRWKSAGATPLLEPEGVASTNQKRMQTHAPRPQEGSHRPTAREQLLNYADEVARIEGRAVRALLDIRQTDLAEYTMSHTTARRGHDTGAQPHTTNPSRDAERVGRESPA